MKNVVAVLSAAGRGERTGMLIPKQFIEIGGEPIFITTLKKFIREDINEIILIIPFGWEIDVNRYINKYNLNANITLINGGDSAESSRWNALEYLAKNNTHEDFIVIFHDAVRPNVSDLMINSAIALCDEFGCAIPILPCKDSMCMFIDGKIRDACSNIDKVRLQTPQAFDFKAIYSAYNSAEEWQGSPILNYLLFNKDIITYSGDEINFKITTVDDIEMYRKLKEKSVT